MYWLKYRSRRQGKPTVSGKGHLQRLGPAGFCLPSLPKTFQHPPTHSGTFMRAPDPAMSESNQLCWAAQPGAEFCAPSLAVIQPGADNRHCQRAACNGLHGQPTGCVRLCTHPSATISSGFHQMAGRCLLIIPVGP